MAQCNVCGRGSAPSGGICWRCRREYAPTYLDHVMVATGLTTEDMVEASGLSRRTILVMQAGRRVSKESARRLARSLGLDYDLLYATQDDHRQDA